MEVRPSGRLVGGAYAPKRFLEEQYEVIGFISSGTYGRVYKARQRHQSKFYAIKKFKPDKEGSLQYTGISQSGVREISLCTELKHENVIHLVEILLERKCIFLVFEYAEHDLLQMIHHHTMISSPINAKVIKAIMFIIIVSRCVPAYKSL
ncbi:kinase-like protein, partial [Piedraia hortae CBS 480.64]